jgi:hypothetical protein
MTLTLNTLYPHNPECLISLFALQYPGGQERLRREQDAWCGFGRVEKLTEECSALIILPGGAARLAT